MNIWFILNENNYLDFIEIEIIVHFAFGAHLNFKTNLKHLII